MTAAYMQALAAPYQNVGESTPAHKLRLLIAIMLVIAGGGAMGAAEMPAKSPQVTLGGPPDFTVQTITPPNSGTLDDARRISVMACGGGVNTNDDASFDDQSPRAKKNSPNLTKSDDVNDFRDQVAFGGHHKGVAKKVAPLIWRT